jgi:hypothetical protein
VYSTLAAKWGDMRERAFDPRATGWYAGVMRKDPMTPAGVLRALELFGPQARPYNFDDCFDCWGLVRRVFDHLDDGFEMDEELQGPGDPEAQNWIAFAAAGELVPGDLLVTHPHLSVDFHAAFFCGVVGGRDLVYDASPRGSVPLFAVTEDGWKLADARDIHTRYARATETTDRLRNDGGAYLRLWDARQAYYHRGLHERLLAGGAGKGAAAGRELVALRRAAGLSELPFYCLRSLPRDAAGREVYDNLLTRHLDYYVPDGAPVLDDGLEELPQAGEAPETLRPPAPRIAKAPLWIVREGPVIVEWEYRGGVTGCRVELWEETWDCWKHRLLRLDLDEPVTRFTVPDDLLHDDSRFALVVWAHGPGGFSGTALAPFLYRPARDNPLLAYDPIRPQELAPDGGVVLPSGAPAVLTWTIRQPLVSQAGFHLEVFEDAWLLDAAAPVFTADAKGPAARIHKATVPGDVLRAGHSYAWYITVTAADRRTAFAPSEGVFRVAREG